MKAEMAPGADITDPEDLLTDIRQRASTIFHPVSTCRMGPKDQGNVVGHDLKLHGIEGLRVADTSIFPAMISGNTNAAAIMVGEKASDIILDEVG